MTTFRELFGRDITPKTKDRRNPSAVPLSTPIRPNTERPHDQYEADVFNFLLDNKGQLGVKTVMKFTALLVDGAVELIDGRRFIVDVKYRMNWEKACQAEWQFRHFMKRADAKPFSVDGGIVVFEEFSGDQNGQAACRLLENGWNSWYRGHADVDGARMDLLRRRAGKLEGFPMAEAIFEKIKNMPKEEASKIFTALAGRGG